MNNPTRPYIMVIILIVVSSTIFLNITNWQTKYTPLHIEYLQHEQPEITGMSPTRIGTGIIFFNRPKSQPPVIEIPKPPRVYSYSPPTWPPERPPEIEHPIEPPKPAEHIAIVPYVLTTNLWGIFTITAIILLTIAIIFLKRRK